METTIAARGATVVLFWIAAVLLVLAAHQLLDPVSAAAAVTMKVVVIVATAFVYIRVAARTATLGHALFVGIFWLTLGIVVELVTASMSGHGWFEIIGSPAKPLQRDLMLVAWIAAPTIFARYRE